MQLLPQALIPLAEYKQFILYKLVPSKTIPGKTDKFPIDWKTLSVVNAHNPNIWTDANTAITVAKLYGVGYGVAFVFTKNDPFYFIDIDDCVVNGQWSNIANDLMTRFNGAAIEVSQSGEGLHIFGTGYPTVKSNNRRKKAIDPITGNKNDLFDLYTEGRFAALTGSQIIGDISIDGTNQLNVIIDYWLKQNNKGPNEWTKTPVSEWNGYTDDNKLIEKAINSKSAASGFGKTASFKELWTNDTNLVEYYEDDHGLGILDDSKADQALAQHLAFWTGNNCERIYLLMWRSSLVRDKWNRPDYLIRTITKAISMQTIVYTAGSDGDTESILKLKGTPKQIEYANTIIAGYNDDRILSLRGPAKNASFWIENKDKTIDQIIAAIKPVESATNPLGTLAGPDILEGYQFLGVTQQIEHFKGCVYIQDIHKIFTPAGALLKSEQFNATYGGYVFQLDSTGNGKTTRKAWDAFTESQLIRYPKAELMCFRPDTVSGALIREEGRTLVNTYIPINTPRKQGDVSPFLNHLNKVLPNKKDQSILLAYMAACIQYKGVKFQWAPLIQGVEGNGKTLFTRCVKFAIGKRYSHMPRAHEISEKFNAWLFNKLFIGVEDIYVPEHKSEIIEILKPMITGEDYEKRDMGIGGVMHELCCNFIFNSNYKDAVRKTHKDRRFAVFYSAQQEFKDIERDGMTGDYFPKLYEWLKYNDGYAIVANYLETYQIAAELNPADACHRAPKTSTTAEAIKSSMGAIEQEIVEAIDEGRPGFAGGWISSIALERLLQAMRATRIIPHNKRREVLQSLGYDWHPALQDGRVNNIILVDGGKPRLFIKNGHISANLNTAVEVAKAYQEAQGAAAPITHAEKMFNK